MCYKYDSRLEWDSESRSSSVQFRFYRWSPRLNVCPSLNTWKEVCPVSHLQDQVELICGPPLWVQIPAVENHLHRCCVWAPAPPFSSSSLAARIPLHFLLIAWVKQLTRMDWISTARFCLKASGVSTDSFQPGCLKARRFPRRLSGSCWFHLAEADAHLAALRSSTVDFLPLCSNDFYIASN